MGRLGLLAQLVEQLTLNQRVVGSIPSQPTKLNRHLGQHPKCLHISHPTYIQPLSTLQTIFRSGHIPPPRR